MTVHLVHADSEGKLAVVAVLLQKGNDSALVGEWKNLPNQKDEEVVLDNVKIDVSHLLPTDRSYYTFSGSLTTPQCTEGVTWFVLKHPTTVSAEEIKRFSQLYRDDARPNQPLHDRIMAESQ